MICIHHNKDMDGYCSGALVKLKYPDAKLIGWDYSEELPDFEQFKGQEVIMIDISFPVDKIKELEKICSHLTIIDHHISFYKTMAEEYKFVSNSAKSSELLCEKLRYIYEDGIAACEIGWKYLFPDKEIPYGVKLISRYDTWRQSEGDWTTETLPFKYYMYGNCNSAESFPVWVFGHKYYSDALNDAVKSGISIMRYQETMDESIAKKNHFVMEEVFGALTAICLNYYPFSSETLKSVFDEELYDIMVGFCYVGNGKWSVSLRSTANSGVDVSLIAKAKGGGGHKNAAGFEAKNFEDIFK